MQLLGGGAIKLGLDVSGNEEASDKTPTSVSGIVMVTTNYMVGSEVFSEKTIMKAEIVEGVLTLKPQELVKGNLLQKLDQGVAVTNLVISITNAPSDLMAAAGTGMPKVENKTTAVAVSTYVAPPANLPTEAQIKAMEKKQATKKDTKPETKTETKKETTKATTKVPIKKT